MAIPIIGPTIIVQSKMAIVLVQWQEGNYAKDGRFAHFPILSDSEKREESHRLYSNVLATASSSSLFLSNVALKHSVSLQTSMSM